MKSSRRRETRRRVLGLGQKGPQRSQDHGTGRACIGRVLKAHRTTGPQRGCQQGPHQQLGATHSRGPSGDGAPPTPGCGSDRCLAEGPPLGRPPPLLELFEPLPLLPRRLPPRGHSPPLPNVLPGPQRRRVAFIPRSGPHTPSTWPGPTEPPDLRPPHITSGRPTSLLCRKGGAEGAAPKRTDRTAARRKAALPILAAAPRWGPGCTGLSARG